MGVADGMSPIKVPERVRVICELSLASAEASRSMYLFEPTFVRLELVEQPCAKKQITAIIGVNNSTDFIVFIRILLSNDNERSNDSSKPRRQGRYVGRGLSA